MDWQKDRLVGRSDDDINVGLGKREEKQQGNIHRFFWFYSCSHTEYMYDTGVNRV